MHTSQPFSVAFSAGFPAVHFPIRLIGAAALCLGTAAQAQVSSYLQNLLDATPAGGWVQANSTTFLSAKPSGADGLPAGGYTNPKTIINAWSGMTWDSTRQNMMLWGGGHANYKGNEMYLWQSSDGAWTRGSLPSRIENVIVGTNKNHWLVVDDRAPQSSHTYEGNLYLPRNDMFVTFGGPVFNTGGPFQVRDAAGAQVLAGPWLFDPRKADANKVGGTTGSGYNPTTLGGEMWTNRQGKWTGLDTTYGSFINNSSAYREENGHDVVYITMKASPSNWPLLYRYTFGDVRAGELDKWELVGTSRYAPAGQSTGTIDDVNNLYVHTAFHKTTTYDLNVWDLSKSGMANRDVAIDLKFADGSEFRTNTFTAIEWADVDGGLWMWDGKERGTVYRTEVMYNSDGSIASQWVVEKMFSATTATPNGSFVTGVLGKWQYLEELDVFMALDEFSNTTLDAGVWFYKPGAPTGLQQIAQVPEPSAYWLMLGGLTVGALYRRRERKPA